jgi:hypothetical protein
MFHVNVSRETVMPDRQVMGGVALGLAILSSFATAREQTGRDVLIGTISRLLLLFVGVWALNA